MAIDTKLVQLFHDNYDEMHRSASRLISSYHRVSQLMPLNESTFNTLDDDFLERLDAFRVRFTDVQDCLGQKLFRSILAIEEEQPGTGLDVVNKMLKREIIPSYETWQQLRNLRNFFTHDYPNSDNIRMESLNLAFTLIPELIVIANNLADYVKTKLNIDLSAFTELSV